MTGRRVTALSAIAAAAAVLYGARLRALVLTWGATEGEAGGELPGDDLLPVAGGICTRAVAIAAPPEAIWPWLVQLGPAPRGGAYTYDWIENLLGLHMHSSDHVLEEFQDPAPGVTIEFGSNVMRMELVDRERALAWRSGDGNWVWSFVIEPDAAGSRLVSRNRYRLPSFAAKVGMLVLEPASLVMERKMLLGIRDRAERLARSGDAPPAA